MLTSREDGALFMSGRGGAVDGTPETRLSGVLEAVPDAIVGVDRDGQIVLVNSHAERLFGYDHGELLGLPVEVLVPIEVRSVHPTHRARYFEAPHPRPMGAGMQLAGRRRDGSEFPAEISLSAIETDAGTVVTAAVRDVSERRRADAHFRGLLEAAPDAMICVEADGRVALMNAQAERLFGYRREELVGQSIEILVPESAREIHPKHRKRYFAEPAPRPMGAGMELVARRKDGTEFPAEISLSALQTDEGTLVSAAVRDVTERLELQAEKERLKAQADQERLERQLTQSQRLESLGQLAGGVAHDFNNLLAVIGSYADFVAEEVELAQAGDFSRPWDAVKSDLDQVRQATTRAAQLTHQLLAFARREVGRPVVLSLNEVVGNLEELLRRSIGERVDLVTSLDPNLWNTTADPGQIEQVLINLAVNARDAMPDGGRLSIDTANYHVDEEFASSRPDLEIGRYVRLRVNDTGIGMEPDIVARAFEPFFTTKPTEQGTGLGLATVYGIIKQAEGYAQLYSEPGFGTTFTALLPATGAATTNPEEQERAHNLRGGETVLVTEDEDAIREVSKRILERNGYTVLTAEDGFNALQVFEIHQGEIHLLLTDVVMPRMLGKELAERVTSLSPKTRVLFMSGYAEPAFGTKGQLDADIVLLEKPFSESSLLEKVRQVLDKEG